MQQIFIWLVSKIVPVRWQLRKWSLKGGKEGQKKKMKFTATNILKDKVNEKKKN